MRFVAVILLVFQLLNSFAANNFGKKEENNSQPKEKAQILIDKIEAEIDRDTLLCLNLIEDLRKLGEENENPIIIGRSIQEKGKYYKKRGNFAEAINHFLKAVEIFSQEKDSMLMAGVFNNLGATYADKGEYKKSTEYILKALKIYESKSDQKLVSKCLHNLGLVFYYQKNYTTALHYYEKALKIRESINDSIGIALTSNNIGIIYYFQKQPDEAVSNFKKALKIYKDLGKLSAMSMPVYNIAEIYFNKKKLDSAAYYANWSYKLDTSLNDQASLIKSLLLLSRISHYNKNGKLALKYASQSLKIAQEIDSRDDLKDCYELLAEITRDNGNTKDACLYFEMALKWKDSLYNKQNAEVVAELETKYESEKKDLLLEKQEITIENQKKVSFILITGIIISLILLSLVFVQYRQKIKAFVILKIQKKNITDSINYASRIQTALLPPAELMDKYLPKHFVLYIPKDIVSGDFYWIDITESSVFMAVADCTGHGVPGAFMSMLGVAYLNEIVNRTPHCNANEVLDLLRLKVTQSLHQNANSISKDGLDISLLKMDLQNMKMQFSGANNPIIICRNHELSYLHPDKMPIGIHFTNDEPFQLKNFELQKNDTVYLFTDGYVDQFGGESSKKIGKNNFNNLLVEASFLEIERQGEFLKERFYEWKRDLDQMDDVLIVGIKI